MLKSSFHYILWLLMFFPLANWAMQVGPNEVQAQLIQVQQEINLLKQHFHIQENIQTSEIKKAEFPSRYSWQKTYEILFKINILREKLDLPIIALPSQQPSVEMTSLHVYEQVRRILTELELLKFHLNIEEKTALVSSLSGKTTTDNFNLLNQISYQLDSVNQVALTPSMVFSQAMRIYEDINVLLETLKIDDQTIPPAKSSGVTSKDNFEIGLSLLKEIKRLHRIAGIEGTDLYALKFPDNQVITPTEVFSLMGIILAELQALKGYLGLKYVFTPLTDFYYDRISGDVQQILGWSLRKIQLIQSLD